MPFGSLTLPSHRSLATGGWKPGRDRCYAWGPFHCSIGCYKGVGFRESLRVLFRESKRVPLRESERVPFKELRVPLRESLRVPVRDL